MSILKRIGILFLLLIGCSAVSEENVPQHIQELENVTVHTIPANPDTVRLTADQRFTGNDSLLLNSIRDIAVDTSGMVYIGDSDRNAIHAFLPNGTYSTTIGGEGNGPGEFRRIWKIKAAADRLYGYDSPNMRLNIYALETKKPVDQIDFDPANFRDAGDLEGFSSLSSFYPINDNRIIAGLGKLTPDNQRPVYYYIIDENGYAVSEQLLEQHEKPAYAMDVDGMKYSLMLPFARESLLDVSPNQTLFTANTDEFLIKTYDTTGTYQRAFYYPYQNAPMVKEEFLNRYPEGPFRKGLSEAEYPETWPALSNMLVDDQSRLWISTITPNEDVYQWWVLDEHGELLGRFTWPRTHEITVIRNGYVYTVENDEETELEEVVRYKIEM